MLYQIVVSFHYYLYNSILFEYWHFHTCSWIWHPCSRMSRHPCWRLSVYYGGLTRSYNVPIALFVFISWSKNSVSGCNFVSIVMRSLVALASLSSGDAFGIEICDKKSSIISVVLYPSCYWNSYKIFSVIICCWSFEVSSHFMVYQWSNKFLSCSRLCFC